MDVKLTSTPLDLMDASTVDISGNPLELDADSSYSVQALLPAGGDGPELMAVHGPFVHLDDQTGVPEAARASGRKLTHLETVSAQAGEDGHLWAWVTSGRGQINIFREV